MTTQPRRTPSSSRRHTGMILALICTVVWTSGPLAAAPPYAVRRLDARLQPGGILRGHLIRSDGKPAVNILVTLYHDGKPVNRVATDDQGQFAFDNLATGPASLTCSGGVLPCRLWQDDLAPPSAVDKLVIRTPDSDAPVVIRGQSDGSLWDETREPFWNRDRGVVVVTAIVGFAVIGAVYSRPDDDGTTTIPDFPFPISP